MLIWIHNPKVGGSIPPATTKGPLKFSDILLSPTSPKSRSVYPWCTLERASRNKV